MRNKVVLITGGARGMGRATGAALAALGAEKIILVDWQGEEGTRVVFGIGTLLHLNTPEQGARTHVWLASSAEVEGVSGEYFENCAPRAVTPLANDQQVRQRLWRWSEEATNVSFPL